MLDNYKPINYNEWNFNGKGENIKCRLNKKEKKIWGIALPFLDKRDDLGHTEIVTYFALELLDWFPNINREVVIPASIFHDGGWSQMEKIELELFYLSKDDGNGKELWRRYEPILRARHQEIGSKLARKILSKNGYSKENVSHSGEIIFGHDTREEFYSPEDGIVRSADKLYRFTYPHLGQALRNRETWTIEKLDQLMSEWVEEKGYFWDDKMKYIAQIEKENALTYNKKVPIIKKGK